MHALFSIRSPFLGNDGLSLVAKFITVLRKQTTDLDTTFAAFRKSVQNLNDTATLTLHEVSKDSNLNIRKGRIGKSHLVLKDVLVKH